MKKLLLLIKNRYKDFTNVLHDLILIGLCYLLINFTVLWFVFGGIIFIFLIYSMFVNNRFIKQAQGNGVIAGGRGSGKGQLLNKVINADKNEYHYSNVPFNERSKNLDLLEYMNSIAPNDIFKFIENELVIIPKLEKYEQINLYVDDIGSIMPNHEDAILKKRYSYMSALLPITRHLYNAYMIITVQDFNRPYKLLRELQTDFGIKAIRTVGWQKVFNIFPFIRYFVSTKYIYYDKIESAQIGLLPFRSKAVLGKAMQHVHLGAGMATKETYEAQNGVIRYGRVIQLKKNVKYDTRHFHKVVFGVEAPEPKKSFNLKKHKRNLKKELKKERKKIKKHNKEIEKKKKVKL